MVLISGAQKRCAGGLSLSRGGERGGGIANTFPRRGGGRRWGAQKTPPPPPPPPPPPHHEETPREIPHPSRATRPKEFSPSASSSEVQSDRDPSRPTDRSYSGLHRSETQILLLLSRRQYGGPGRSRNRGGDSPDLPAGDRGRGLPLRGHEPPPRGGAAGGEMLLPGDRHRGAL